MSFFRHIDTETLERFRNAIRPIRKEKHDEWEQTRKLISLPQLPDTLHQLALRIQESQWPSSLRDELLDSLKQFQVSKSMELNSQTLKALTGFPPTKGLRALCVLFGVLHPTRNQQAVPTFSPEQLEEILAETWNPYNVLLQAEVPSLLDLGAGDLSFEQELVDHYLPHFREQQKPLILHAMDRLQPGSQLGGVYQVNKERQAHLKAYPSNELAFRFWGGVNMMDFLSVKGRRPSYTIVTCHAPATPTFAFEPSRISAPIIASALRQKKGDWRISRLDGEPALEVLHEGRILTFPAWKFDICGPLALLELVACLGQIGVFTAIDSEVFWEILSQLLAGEQYRPADTLFSPDNLPNIFGYIYDTLTGLHPGERIQLGKIADLREKFPAPITNIRYHFRTVEVRRCAMFEGIPSSFTAKQFPYMSEESTPWWLILLPEVQASPH